MFISHGVDTQDLRPTLRSELKGPPNASFFPFSFSFGYLRKAKTKNVNVMKCWKYGLLQENKLVILSQTSNQVLKLPGRNQSSKPHLGSQVELAITRLLRSRVSQMRFPGEEL